MNRKSFIIYSDSLSVLDELTDEQAGRLFKAIKAYHNGDNFDLEFGLKIAFVSFKNQFIRDNNKWEAIREKRIKAGASGGKQKVANATKRKQKTPVSVNDSVSVNVSVINYKEQFEVFRKLFGGTKRGLDTEFEYLQGKHKDWKEVIPKLYDAVQKEIKWRSTAKGFVPEWKNLKTWIYNRCWEQEFEMAVEAPKPVHRPIGTYDKEFGG